MAKILTDNWHLYPPPRHPGPHRTVRDIVEFVLPWANYSYQRRLLTRWNEWFLKSSTIFYCQKKQGKLLEHKIPEPLSSFFIWHPKTPPLISQSLFWVFESFRLLLALFNWSFSTAAHVCYTCRAWMFNSCCRTLWWTPFLGCLSTVLFATFFRTWGMAFWRARNRFATQPKEEVRA